MRPAEALLLTSAAALLLTVAYQAQRIADDLADDDSDTAPNWADQLDAAMSLATSALLPTAAAELQPSAALLAMLKRGEALRLQRYRLGDGGWTIGYGRYYPDGGPLPPAEITREQAESWFIEDVEARGARWVRTYVEVPLAQHQFDALVHMAYNLSPRSFRKIADAVNAGIEPDDAAMLFIRAGTNLEAGLRNRRGLELALYHSGVYA